MNKELIPYEAIENRIFIIRGRKVMLDRDLAELYGVETSALNQAVKRNLERFPDDFMFSLIQVEKVNISQIVICSEKPYESIKHAKNINAFTEHGILMLSSVLNSLRAVQVNIRIMRVFVNLRHVIANNKELAYKLDQLANRVSKHDEDIQEIVSTIRELMAPLPAKKKDIGFKKI